MLTSQYQLTGSACSQVGYFQIATLLMLCHILKSDKLTAGTQHKHAGNSRRNTSLVVSDNNHKRMSAAASTILAV
jgi:hypothetical protein